MNTRVRWLLNQVPLIVLLALLTMAALALPVTAQSYRLEVRADPPRLTYQSDSPNNNRVIIWVKVRDDKGQPAPDMTPVRFATSLGTITPLVYARNGELSATMENLQGPGRAKVDVQTENGGFSTIYIEFLGPNGVPVKTTLPPRIRYSLTAKQCYYSADKYLFDLRDSAKFVMPDLTVTASAIQFDVRQKILTAQFGVVITKGKESISAQRVRLEFGQNIGVAEIIEPEIGKKLIDLSTFKLSDDPRTQTVSCEPLDPMPTRTWILCPEVTIFPTEQQIQFRRPKFYVHNVDLPILILPYHVLNYSASQANTMFNFQATITSDPGVNIDFPVYYAASGSHIGSFHIRNLTKSSSPTGISGLQFGIEEEYRLDNKADGALYLDDLSRETRSVSWEHSEDFGLTHINTTASYDRYSATDSYTTRANISISRPMGQVGTSFSGSFSNYQSQRTYDTTLYFSPPSIKLGRTKFSLNFNPFLGWQSSTTADSTSEGGFSEGINSSLGIPSFNLMSGTVMTSVSDGISHYADNSLVNNFDTSVRYQRRFFNMITSSLGYSYNIQRSSNPLLPKTPASQIIDLNVSGGDKKNIWTFYGDSSYTLNTQSLFSAANITYYLPWWRSKEGVRRWFLQYDTRLSIMSNSTIDRSFEHIITLGHPIGTYNLLLHYSPTGNTGLTGIGMFTGRQWALELVRSGW